MLKKISLCALAVCSALSGASVWAADSNYQLEQVLMLSRHNLRAPLADNGSVLAQATKKNWPQWDTAGGQLTTKGGVLEIYMGHYTRQWLAQQNLIGKDACPAPDAVYAYANSLQRTVATAQFFVSGAFPGCDISVYHQDKMGEMDPVFNPVILNTSDDFNKTALSAMNAESEKLALKPAFQRLESIIDYKDSPACKGKKQCSLSSDNQNTFSAQQGKEPGVSGPLKVGNSLVDAFTLQYYEGMPLDQVAWGQIKTDEQWKLLSAIKNGYQDTLFTSPAVARDVAAPLVDYIRNLLVVQDKADTAKVTLLVGHDSNIASLLTALSFKPYELADQNERTPIGGMIQFQRWLDKKNNRELVKVEYVYQSTEQLRNAEPLSLDNPPKRVTLQMDGCETDAAGYCSWDKFTAVLKNALQGTALQPAVSTETRADDASAAPAETQQKGDVNQDQPATDKPAQGAGGADKTSADKSKSDAGGVAQSKDSSGKPASDKAVQTKATADEDTRAPAAEKARGEGKKAEAKADASAVNAGQSKDGKAAVADDKTAKQTSDNSDPKGTQPAKSREPVKQQDAAGQ